MPIHMTVTDGVVDADKLTGELRKYVDVETPKFVALCSIDPPQFIKLLGDAAAWLPLALPATFFLKSYFSELGKSAAKGTSDFLKRALGSVLT